LGIGNGSTHAFRHLHVRRRATRRH
jgi:hypothetical protein